MTRYLNPHSWQVPLITAGGEEEEEEEGVMTEEGEEEEEMEWCVDEYELMMRLS